MLKYIYLIVGALILLSSCGENDVYLDGMNVESDIDFSIQSDTTESYAIDTDFGHYAVTKFFTTPTAFVYQGLNTNLCFIACLSWLDFHCKSGRNARSLGDLMNELLDYVRMTVEELGTPGGPLDYGYYSASTVAGILFEDKDIHLNYGKNGGAWTGSEIIDLVDNGEVFIAISHDHAVIVCGVDYTDDFPRIVIMDPSYIFTKYISVRYDQFSPDCIYKFG